MRGRQRAAVGIRLRRFVRSRARGPSTSLRCGSGCPHAGTMASGEPGSADYFGRLHKRRIAVQHMAVDEGELLLQLRNCLSALDAAPSIVHGLCNAVYDASSARPPVRLHGVRLGDARRVGPHHCAHDGTAVRRGRSAIVVTSRGRASLVAQYGDESPPTGAEPRLDCFSRRSARPRRVTRCHW